MLHYVVDGHPGIRQAARGIDVEEDVFARVSAVEVEDLGDEQVGDLVVYFLAQKNDPLAQQKGVDVEGPFASGRLVEHRGYYRHERLLRVLGYGRAAAVGSGYRVSGILYKRY